MNPKFMTARQLRAEVAHVEGQLDDARRIAQVPIHSKRQRNLVVWLTALRKEMGERIERK